MAIYQIKYTKSLKFKPYIPQQEELEYIRDNYLIFKNKYMSPLERKYQNLLKIHDSLVALFIKVVIFSCVLIILSIFSELNGLMIFRIGFITCGGIVLIIVLSAAHLRMKGIEFNEPEKEAECIWILNLIQNIVAVESAYAISKLNSSDFDSNKYHANLAYNQALKDFNTDWNYRNSKV
jgi:archaellum biogenesis protein FlaJ (TadC family)